jgi:glycogen synthase
VTSASDHAAVRLANSSQHGSLWGSSAGVRQPAGGTLSDYRIGFSLAGDPDDPSAYSGAPASLIKALCECGTAVLPISTDLSPAAQRLLINLLTIGFLEPRRLASEIAAGAGVRPAFRAHKPKLLPSRELTAIRSFLVARRLRRSGTVSRMIQFGSEYRLPPGTDYVTLDDATIVQLHRSYSYDWMAAVPESALRKMIARQRRIFRAARACCVLNHWAAASVVDDYGVPAGRVHVVGAGPNRELAPVPRSWDVPRFLFVGKDFERKNGHRVVDAFRHVRDQFPAATLDVVGDHPRLGFEGVACHGELRLGKRWEGERLNSLFARATCLVMPSLLEPTGNVHAEALAAGIGSIGTRCGGVATVIGDAGVTVEPRDTSSIIAAMLRFCEPTVMRDYGRRAQLRAPLFTWKAVAERVIRALQLPGVDEGQLAEFL